MSLSPGTRLGPYEIVGPLGAGGMGEVYRATDTLLKRPVAIKVLPTSVADDPDRLARFQREAEVLAALNHPNIAHVHGLEKSGTAAALVMELVEGDDLSVLIARGPIPIEDALPIARQIADALEAAHEQGIIHRDLKPANIKVRPDGAVKVLDFGLAKALAPAAAASTAPDNSPTLTTPAMTHAGMILGTAAYMSPEQARGKVVDRRADIWAFGVVIFEMLTGRRAFPGEDVTDTIVALVSREPDWSALPPVPSSLRRLLARCLKKDPKARLRDIGEARVQIEELLLGGAVDAPATPPLADEIPARLPRRRSSRAAMWVWAAATIALMVAVVWLWAPGRANTPPAIALQFTPFSFEQGGQSSPVWSPDGKAVAFAASQKPTDSDQVYVRYLDSPVATQITRFGSAAVPIEWTTTGRIIFRSTKAPAGLWSVSPVGGEPQPLQAIDRATSASVTRDGTAMAWLHRPEDGEQSVWTSSPIGAPPTRYEPAPFASRIVVNSPLVRFSPDGKQILLWRGARAGEEAWLMPYPANAAVPPRRILQDLPVLGTPDFSWMPDSRHIVVSTTPGAAPDRLYLADTVSEKFVVLSSGTTAQQSPAVSPDGNKVAFVEATRDYDIVSVDLATAAVTPVISTQRSEQMPSWAGQESALTYVSNRNGPLEIWLMKPGQPDRPLVTARDFPSGTTDAFMAPVLSPDATRVIYTRLEKSGTTPLWMSAVAGSAPVRLLKDTTENGYAGSWSPDGNWFVYLSVSDQGAALKKVKTTGQAEPEVLKIKLTRTGLGGTSVPLWSPAGDWILHLDSGLKLVSPDGQTTRDLSAFRAMAYAFSPDGRTLYGVRPITPQGLELFSIGVAGGPEKIIGRLGPEYVPLNALSPALRLTVSPDGKSLTYSTRKSTSNLWLAEGLKAVTLR